MTESEINESAADVFARIGRLAGDSGVAIKRTLTSSSLKLEFADGQRIIINHDERTHKIWLAARSSGIEYTYNGSNWLSQPDGSELFAKLAELFNQLINSSPVNGQPGKLVEISHAPALSYTGPEVESGSPIKKIVLFGLLAWAGYAGFNQFFRGDLPSGTHIASIETSVGTRASAGTCDASRPGNGVTHIFPASNIQSDNPGNTEITLQNDHGHAILATFAAPKTVIPYLSVLVLAGQSARIGLPTGEYDLLFSIGDLWCNSLTGFSDGRNIKLNSTLTVQPLKPLQLIAQSSGSSTADIQLLIKSLAPPSEPPPFRFIGNGVMEIPKHLDGHYHITGSVNGSPVTYLIDTGATLTSLSAKTANQAKIRDCKPTTFRTASGTISGCIAMVPELTIGTFQLQNISVAVMPDMEVDLLGMNVLSHFEMKQVDGVMHLSYR